MPTNNQRWTYDQFLEQADERLAPQPLPSATRLVNNARRGGQSPFRSNSAALDGINWLATAESAIRRNMTFDDSTYMETRRGYSQGYADYLRYRKGLYQFIKDTPQPVDRGGAIRSYTAMRALRIQAAAIHKAARMYGAGELSLQACQTVRHFREDYRTALNLLTTSGADTRNKVVPMPDSGYTVVRWFDNRKIEYHLAPQSRNTSRVEAWREVVAHFRQAISSARAERRQAIGDSLAIKPTNIHLQKNALKLLRQYKKPDENVRSVGIEIECFMPRNADMTKLYPVAQYVNIGSDGSIHPEGDNMAGVEFRVCAPNYKMVEVVKTLCAILKDIGAKVNASCGLHVHLDQRNRTLEEVSQTFSNFIRAQNLLLEVVPKSRRGNNYCKKHRGTDFDQATRGGRYKIVNASAYRKHKTIEIRLFNGTVNAEKIINWVKTLWAIEAGQPVLRCPKTFDIARRYWALDPTVLAWLKKRQDKFKQVTADNTDVMDAEPIEEN